MIKCPKCGADNMYNAIFCRSCGEKLNLEDLKIENQLDDIDDKKGDSSKLANQIVGGVLAFVIVIIVALLFIPTTGALTPVEVSEAEKEKLTKLVKAPDDASLEIPQQELTNILNQAMEFPKESQDTIVPKYCSVTADEDGTVKVTMVSTAFGFLPFKANFSAKPVFAAKGEFTFEDMSGIKLGWLPFMPEAVIEPFVKPFKDLAENSKPIKLARKHTKSVTVSEGKFVFEVEKKVKKSKKGKKGKKGKKAGAPQQEGSK